MEPWVQNLFWCAQNEKLRRRSWQMRSYRSRAPQPTGETGGKRAYAEQKNAGQVTISAVNVRPGFAQARWNFHLVWRKFHLAWRKFHLVWRNFYLAGGFFSLCGGIFALPGGMFACLAEFCPVWWVFRLVWWGFRFLPGLVGF